MQTREIVEGNKLIAEFMGLEYYQNPDITASLVRYHDLWGWLMPVVEKIMSMGWKFELICSEVDNDATFSKAENFIQNVAWSTPLLATYNTVVDFIKWYNSSNESKLNTSTCKQGK